MYIKADMVNPLVHWLRIPFDTILRIPLRGLSRFQGIVFRISLSGLSGFWVTLGLVVPELLSIFVPVLNLHKI